jgi:sulfotransferase family protein
MTKSFPRRIGKSALGIYNKTLMAYRRAIPREPMLPGFVIIGVMKGGTTSLYYGLADHPNIQLPVTKQIHFFDLNYPKGRRWYEAHFPTRKAGKISGEATPDYLFYHPDSARRLYESLPDARLIALLRNPVDRAFSHYNHMIRLGKETLSFEEALDREDERLSGEAEKLSADPSYYSFNRHYLSYLSRGRYFEQIEQWLSAFPAEQLLVLNSHSFFDDPDRGAAQVIDFLGLPAARLENLRRLNTGRYDNMNPATRQRLIEYFRPHNARLYKRFGDFNWDS